MEKIKIGVIGCGHLGKMHLKNLKEISKEDPNVELTGIYDIDFLKSKEMSVNHNIIAFEKLDDLLNNIDAAIIVTPTSTHFQIAKDTLGKNIHTFIEKPVTASLKEAYELKKISQQSNSIIQIGHIERFNPAILSLGNTDIRPTFIESHRISNFNPRGTDVSVVQDLMIHDIDIILNLVKSKVKSIDASGVAIISNKIDISNARIKFENGCVANITASRISMKKMRKMRIFQKDKYISIDFQENKSEIVSLSRKPATKLSKISLTKFVMGDTEFSINIEKPKVKESNPMKYELKLFIDCIKKKITPIVSLDDGIQALEVATEIITKSNESLAEINSLL